LGEERQSEIVVGRLHGGGQFEAECVWQLREIFDYASEQGTA
jgi:hypothetical protein